MELPLVLAGPILRRVEPSLVTIWVALRGSGTVKLALWENQFEADDGSTHLWLGRRKAVGRGEGSSGLRFDSVEL
ncbi:hypothetical protein BH18ACI4_BH18ACI4_06700 [soil metagenome]